MSQRSDAEILQGLDSDPEFPRPYGPMEKDAAAAYWRSAQAIGTAFHQVFRRTPLGAVRLVLGPIQQAGEEAGTIIVGAYRAKGQRIKLLNARHATSAEREVYAALIGQQSPKLNG